MVKNLLDRMCAGDWRIKRFLCILMKRGITEHLHGFGLQEKEPPM